MKPNSPTHYVDTSVFIEALTSPREDEGRACSRYLARLGRIYQWVIGLPVFAEYMVFALDKKPELAADEVFLFFWRIYQDRNPVVILPEPSVYENAKLVKEIDPRLSLLDCLHLATAKGNAQIFVTIDKEIRLSQRLEKELGIRVRHPSMLL